MRNRKNWILVMAIAGIIIATASIALLTQQRSKILVDTGETRASVASSLDRLLLPAAELTQDQRLLTAAKKLNEESYVASVWLVDKKGKIFFHERGPGKRGDNVKDFAQGDMAKVLEALEPGTLSESQKLQLLTVGAIRSEGEHNDVFRHLVRPVSDKNGNLVALVALAYDVSPDVGSADASLLILTLIPLVGFIVYWLGLPLWVYLDARARGETAALWAVFVLLTNLVGLLAYLIVISKTSEQRAIT